MHPCLSFARFCESRISSYHSNVHFPGGGKGRVAIRLFSEGTELVQQYLRFRIKVYAIGGSFLIFQCKIASIILLGNFILSISLLDPFIQLRNYCSMVGTPKDGLRKMTPKDGLHYRIECPDGWTTFPFSQLSLCLPRRHKIRYFLLRRAKTFGARWSPKRITVSLNSSHRDHWIFLAFAYFGISNGYLNGSCRILCRWSLSGCPLKLTSMSSNKDICLQALHFLLYAPSSFKQSFRSFPFHDEPLKGIFSFQ